MLVVVCCIECTVFYTVQIHVALVLNPFVVSRNRGNLLLFESNESINRINRKNLVTSTRKVRIAFFVSEKEMNSVNKCHVIATTS